MPMSIFALFSYVSAVTPLCVIMGTTVDLPGPTYLPIAHTSSPLAPSRKISQHSLLALRISFLNCFCMVYGMVCHMIYGMVYGMVRHMVIVWSMVWFAIWFMVWSTVWFAVWSMGAMAWFAVRFIVWSMVFFAVWFMIWSTVWFAVWVVVWFVLSQPRQRSWFVTRPARYTACIAAAAHSGDRKPRPINGGTQRARPRGTG